MFGGHTYELVIVLIALVVCVGGAFLLVRLGTRMVARIAAQEYARARMEEEQRQRRP